MSARELAKLIVHSLEEKKAEDIRIIDISKISTIADYFIIANGTNRNQVQALADNVGEDCHKAGYALHQTEGYNSANWILMDYSDVIVHIFQKKTGYFMTWNVSGEMEFR